MTQGDILGILRDALYTAFIIAAPVLLISVLVGLVVSIIQAATQVHEQTISFVPKIIAIALVLVAGGSWMLTQLSDFTHRMFEFALNFM